MLRLLIKYYFWVCLWGCFWKRLAFKSIDCVKITLTNVGGHHSILWGPLNRTKRWRKGEFVFLAWAGTFIFLASAFRLLLGLTPLAPLVPRLWIWTRTTPQVSWASSLQTVYRGTSQPPKSREPICCRNRDPFQGPRVSSCLTHGNELPEETHVLTKQETLLGRGAQVESSRVREPRRTALPRRSQSQVLW